MSDRDDGGSAFPYERTRYDRSDEWKESQAGMTLRDYFAASVLPAMMQMTIAACTANAPQGLLTNEEMARGAYRLADAMLAERNKP